MTPVLPMGRVEVSESLLAILSIQCEVEYCVKVCACVYQKVKPNGNMGRHLRLKVEPLHRLVCGACCGEAATAGPPCVSSSISVPGVSSDPPCFVYIHLAPPPTSAYCATPIQSLQGSIRFTFAPSLLPQRQSIRGSPLNISRLLCPRLVVYPLALAQYIAAFGSHSSDRFCSHIPRLPTLPHLIQPSTR